MTNTTTASVAAGVARLEIRGLNLGLTEALLAHVRDRLGAALRSAGAAVRSATVRLKDVNGDRGGVDKRCHVAVAMAGAGSPVVAEYTAADLYDAVTAAADRLRRGLARRTQRAQAVRRRRRVSSSGLPT